jgi:drug/metabolite transporter (DMT)-like permease
VAPLPFIATYAYVNPVVAVVLGAVVRQEPIDERTLLAGAVIVAAVALIVTARGRMASPRAGTASRHAPSPAPRTEVSAASTGSR